MMLSIFLCSESLPATLDSNGPYILSSAPATTSTQVYGVGKACRCAVDLSEVMGDDPLASVRSVPPFAPLRSPSLPSDPRKEKS